VEAWVARGISAVVFPHLKDISVSRAMLRNEEVRLFNPREGEKLVYSADLSKSTDPIGVGTARFVLHEVGKWIHIPDWYHAAVDGCLKPHELHYNGRKETTHCGALMGQGPGWAVLTILNSFCAWSAGAPKGSFKTCGDDLTALWGNEVILGYESEIDAIGLKANVSKSFRHPSRGVFCEQLITRTGTNTACGERLLRIGEATGSRALAKGKGRVVTDQLQHIQSSKALTVLRPVLTATRRAAKRGMINSSVRGRFSEGGCGQGRANVRTFRNFLSNGPIRIFLGESTSTMKQMRAALHDARMVEEPGTDGKVVDIDEIIVEAMTRQERRSRELSLRQGSKPSYAPLKSLKNQLRAGEKMPEDYSPITHLEIVNERIRLDKSDLRRCKHYLRRRAYGPAIRIIKRRTTRLNAETAFAVLNSHFPRRSRCNLSLQRVSHEAGFNLG
jgi:hypothetical protein